MKQFDFDGLFILDLANNHQGDVEHGLAILRSFGEVVRGAGHRAALKFQFRQLDSFIHPDYVDRDDIDHIPRFVSTRLSPSDYEVLAQEVRHQGMVTMCTPFDEESVDIIVEMDLDVIKVASCSANDWPLIERIVQTGKPVIASTAGRTTDEIDNLVQTFQDRGVAFALMHCVALYPTPPDLLNLNQIDFLRNRYPGVAVGWSTHEDPNDAITVRMAVAKGARLFERHVGLETAAHKLNSYSSTPEQVDVWFAAYREAVAACGGEHRAPASVPEAESLRSLRRGVFASQSLQAGMPIGRDSVFFAMPALDGCLTSSGWRECIVADRDYAENEPLDEKLADNDPSEEQIVHSILLQVKGLLNDARIPIGKDSAVEVSHHYGLHRFREYGAVIIKVINRQYCKKLIVQLPRQKHPYHYHEKKEETFQVLCGDLEIEKDGHTRKLGPGDVYLVEAGAWHKFQTLDGVIFEEVSTTHRNDDSFYMDERIARMPRDERKTYIANWEIDG